MKGVLFISLIFLPIFGFAQKLDTSILEEIKQKAIATHSDALIITQNGKTICKNYYGEVEKPIYIASAGKSLVSLAIGKLLDDNLLDSLDQSVCSLFPQWKQGNKKDITIRMLLNHTSGLQNNPNASVELEPAPTYKVHNIIDLALAAELSDLPGQKVEYNNKAVALLGGIIEKASGKPMDLYIVDEFFKPLNIADYDWIKDASGNPTAHGAFVIKPSDFLKFGELILNKGIYNGHRILSEQWINESLKQGQEFTPIWGLLWWRLPDFEKRIIDDDIWKTWEQANLDKEFLKNMKPLKGKLFETKYDFFDALEKTIGKGWNQILNEMLPANLKSSKRIYGEKIIAYYADGFRGNYLVIVPEYNIVAVRCADPNGFNYDTDFYTDFVSLISKLGK
ncbi:MAG: penicillin-binding protein [Flavobacteriaceae bacterium CG17_big_fil_post_rev_8_21_14_2_50_33_15]|nr:MAG: penicillin-binding protein [Flavobacteriaceae bacterium CG17_big_fil_post_rev_8_21_14_2_50_33_15]PJB19297.1 MAG: penicillin-binding protein [Flavobacteriaceae bacterium CG_4_9_14_3_um_filter_33_16]